MNECAMSFLRLLVPSAVMHVVATFRFASSTTHGSEEKEQRVEQNFAHCSPPLLLSRIITVTSTCSTPHFVRELPPSLTMSRTQTTFRGTQKKAKRTYAPTTAELNEAIEDYLHEVSPGTLQVLLCVKANNPLLSISLLCVVASIIESQSHDGSNSRFLGQGARNMADSRASFEQICQASKDWQAHDRRR